jgi:NADH:ubiquinone oxidoreductase subunit K
MLFAGVKIALLVASVGGAVFAKTSLRFIVCAAAILYAFPLGVLIEGALTGRAHGQGAAILLSVSAAASYASVAALVVLWRRARSRDRASR